MVERNLAKVEVASSRLVSRSSIQADHPPAISTASNRAYPCLAAAKTASTPLPLQRSRFDLSAVRLDNRLADRQPHPHARFLSGCERVEQMVHDLRGNTWARVGDRRPQRRVRITVHAVQHRMMGGENDGRATFALQQGCAHKRCSRPVERRVQFPRGLGLPRCPRIFDHAQRNPCVGITIKDRSRLTIGDDTRGEQGMPLLERKQAACQALGSNTQSIYATSAK